MARSLTPLFNGFRAARDRASQLGGRYAKRSRLSSAVTSRKNTKQIGLLASGDSSRGKLGDCQPGELSVHTGDVAPLQGEKRVLRFNTLVREGQSEVLVARHQKREQEKPIR